MVQQAIIRYEDENSGLFPATGHTTSADFTTLVKDGDFNGTIDIVIDNGVSTNGTTPTTDVTTCFNTTSVAAAVGTCFGALDFALLVPDFLSGPAKHFNDNVLLTDGNAVTGDDDMSTPELTIENCDLGGTTCKIYLQNAQVLTSAMNVWLINQENTAFTMKADDFYGK